MDEEALHEVIRARARNLPEFVRIGPGDDMALVEVGGSALLVAADQVVEGRHFVRGTPWDRIAYKALARNLSDVAAMAGEPVACLATLAAPRGRTDSDALHAALHALGLALGCPLVGGDYCVVPADAPLTLSVTVLARQGPQTVTRTGARPGDGLFVTGSLGGSLGVDRMGRHLSFVPRLSEARELARTLGTRLHAMIDLSDGLGRDGARLARASGVRLELEAASIPCSTGCGIEQAIGDGEDYELLFAASGEVPASVCGTRVTRIGRVCAIDGGEPSILLGSRDIGSVGFEHSEGG